MTEPAAVQVDGRDVSASGQVQGRQWRILAIERPELMALAYIYAGQGIAVTSQIRQQRVCGEIQRRYLLPRNRQLLQRTEHLQTMD